jgi:hypothetical protein
MQRLTQEQKLERLTKLVGAYIKYVRENGKAPSVAGLYMKTFNKHLAGPEAQIIRKTLEECVAHVGSNGSARLYRDNRTPKELMPVFLEFYAQFSGKKIVEETPEVEAPVEAPVQTVPMTQIDFSELSDDELAAIGHAYSQEVQRREQKNRKREQLATILALAEMSAEDLISLIEECK